MIGHRAAYDYSSYSDPKLAHNLTALTDSLGNRTEYTYDPLGRLSKTTYPDGSTQEYGYDSAGNLLQEKQRSGTVVTNGYDNGNRLISRTITKASGVEGTSTESYLYDGLNRLTKGTNDVSVVERRYDSLSRLIEEVQDGKSVQYGYDKVGNPTSIRYPNQRLVEREFDLLNRVSRVKQGSDVISTMEFLGRSYRLASKGYQNGDLVKYLYDQGRRLTSSETKNKNQAILQSFGWGYDTLDFKSFEKRLHNGGKGDAFSYDALKRLTNVTFDSPTPETPTATGTRSRAITLDKLDNILKITDNENAMVTEIIGELEGKGKALNQYSRFNDLPLEYDTNGNLSAKGSRLFAYDYRNRLIRSSKGDDAVTFTYDIFGRQTSRTDLSGTYHFFYAGDQKIEERNASGQVTKHYLWGNGIDELLRLDIYNGATATPYYIHTDNIGSTTAVTDGSGNLVERVTYNVYGLPTFTDALGQTLKKSTIRNTTLFQGREYDYDLALYNYRARYFDPTMGRFLQTDPLGYQDSMNLYQGMNMNPVNFIDPWGNLSLKKWLLGASEGFVNFALGIGNAISPQYSPFITSLNFTDPGQPVLITQIDKRSALDKLADLTIVKPTADYLVDLSVNAYFGVIANNINDKVRDEYQQGLSRNLGQLAAIAVTAKVLKPTTTSATPTAGGPKCWNEFQSATKGMFKSRVDAAKVWRSYQSSKESITIVGETMVRVENAASRLPGAKTLNDMPNFKSMSMNADEVTSSMMNYNRKWILNEFRSGRLIIDIGFDINRKSPSIFYQMEQNMQLNYLKLHPEFDRVVHK